MRASVILGLLLLTTPLSPTGLAADPDDPPAQPGVVFDAYANVISSTSARVESVRESVGSSDAKVREATNLLERAQDALGVPDPDTALEATSGALTLAVWREAEHETEDRPDASQAMRDRARQERAATEHLQQDALGALDHLQVTGVNPAQFDRALLASELLAGAARLGSTFSDGMAAWSTGTTAGPGPMPAAVGPRIHATLAQHLLAGVADLDPSGRPIVGNTTLSTVVEAFVPMTHDEATAYDRSDRSRLRAAVDQGAWLQGAGAAVSWAHQQPRGQALELDASGQLPGPAELIERLENAIEVDDSLPWAQRTGAAGAQSAHDLASAIRDLALAKQALASNATEQATEQAIAGLSHLSAARAGTALVRAMAGHGTTTGIIALIDDDRGTLEIEGHEPSEPPAGLLGMGPLGSAVALTLVLFTIIGLVAAYKRYKHDDPPTQDR